MSLLAFYYPKHIFFLVSFSRATLLDVVQRYQAHQSNTKRIVDYNHALTPIQCDVPVHMQCNVPLHVISCHMYNECYMDNINHTTIGCHGQSHHLHMTSIHHIIHVNISCMHISTSTYNMSFYVQAMKHTIKPCNGHLHI